ncbi:MAG: hypothetical protein J0M02_03420 [Planctomycetes bacterium]|nr:hypothetical protein [Planctomycetota bacterium]
MTTSKRIAHLSAPEYQSYVKRLERRYGPEKRWSDLAAIAPPGRPVKGSKRRPLRPRSVKLPDRVWRTLASAAQRHGVTASGVVAGLALQAAAGEDIDRAIDRLIKRGILTPA